MKKLFESYLIKVLKETPWIEVQGKIFDLELENKYTAESFKSYLVDLFSGKEIIDKYGDKIKLTYTEDKIRFYNSLIEDEIFNIFGEKKLGKKEFKQFMEELRGYL